MINRDCCRCSDFLRGQTLQPNVMNIMVCFLPLCCLVYSAAQSSTAEQYLSGQNLLPSSDLRCLRHGTIHALDHRWELWKLPRRALYAARPQHQQQGHSHIHLHPFDTHRADDNCVIYEEFVLDLELQHGSLCPQ